MTLMPNKNNGFDDQLIQHDEERERARKNYDLCVCIELKKGL